MFGLILFSIFINDLGIDTQAETHLFADDTIIYTVAPSTAQAVKEV